MPDRSFATHASIRHHCHFRDKDHVLDTPRKTPSRQARQTDIRPHGRSYRAQPSIHSSSHSPFATHCPARLSPPGKSLHLYLSTTVLIEPYYCILKPTSLAGIPLSNTQAHDSPVADGLALLLNSRLIDRFRIASQPRTQHGGLRSA